MVKLTILFHRPPDPDGFEARYNQNLALLEQLPGIRRRQACLIFGSPAGQSPYYRLLELYFDDRAALDAALLSPEGSRAGADLVAFVGRRADLFFSEVYEA
ncbi:MAG TPA: EthD family reductase [Aggregatilineaceae bacterium]|nr:EthD family reductase [Aggregatilineaceae bacterium]